MNRTSAEEMLVEMSSYHTKLVVHMVEVCGRLAESLTDVEHSSVTFVPSIRVYPTFGLEFEIMGRTLWSSQDDSYEGFDVDDIDSMETFFRGLIVDHCNEAGLVLKTLTDQVSHG